MMKKTFPAFLLSILIICFLGVAMVHAETPGSGTTGGTSGSGTTGGTSGSGTTGNNKVSINIPNPFSKKIGNSLFGLVKAIVDNIILPVGGVLCVLAFIFAGFKYVMAQGKPADIEAANRTLLYAAIGTAVLLGAWVLANAVCKTVELIGGTPLCF